MVLPSVFVNRCSSTDRLLLSHINWKIGDLSFLMIIFQKDSSLIKTFQSVGDLHLKGAEKDL